MTAATEETLKGKSVVVLPYTIGQKVWIEDAELWGRIKQINLAATGREYQVSYYDEDKRRQLEWMSEEELRSAP